MTYYIARQMYLKLRHCVFLQKRNKIQYLKKKTTKVVISETVNQRPDYAISKRKRTKGLTMISNTLHRKLNIEQHEPYKNRGEGTQVLFKD